MATEKLDTRIRQEQIVHAAVAIVAGDGLKQLSVARVARRVGIVPSALYRHFSSKDDILDAVLLSVQERLTQNARAAREEGANAVERLHALFERHLALIHEHPGLPWLVFSEEVYAGQPKRRARMFKGIRAYLDRVADIVREGQERGQVGADVDAAAAAVLFLGLVQPPAILSHLSAGTFDLRSHAEQAWGLYEKALRAR